MSIFEINFQFHNPKNPKCRSCEFYGNKEFEVFAECMNEDFKGNKQRFHNSKACTKFRIKK